jgi:two-component system cell cycle sensor histidine kinase PleC
LATFLASLLALTWLTWQSTAPALVLGPNVEHSVLASAMALAVGVLLLALSQFDGLHLHVRDQLRHEVLSERVASQNLELAKAAAERDSLAKSRLLASVSMDMRAPLTAIIGFSQIIGHEMMGPIGNSQYRSYAEDIESSGYEVLETIERVVALARLQAGEFRLREESFDLNALLHEVVDELRPMAENARMRFSLEAPEGQFFVYADQRSVRQIVLNLLTNAVRHTDVEGRAGLTLKLGEDGEAVLQIWDNGPGIAAERMLQIFDPCAVDPGLSLTEQDRDWTECAHGLGLPVSRLLAERHGGALSVASQPGQGTTVTVTLPAERVSVAVREYSSHSGPRGGNRLYPLATPAASDRHQG